MHTKKYLLNKFTITDAERLVKPHKQLEQLIDGRRLPANIDRKFFIDIVKSNLNSDMLNFHPSSSFKYALSYLRWLKKDKTDLQKFIDNYHLHRDVLNKSYTRTKDNTKRVKAYYIKRDSGIQKTKDELNRFRTNKEKKVPNKNIDHSKSSYRCISCNAYIPIQRIMSLPNTNLCVNCASQDPQNEKKRFVKDTFGSRDDFKRDRGSWRR